MIFMIIKIAPPRSLLLIASLLGAVPACSSGTATMPSDAGADAPVSGPTPTPQQKREVLERYVDLVGANYAAALAAAKKLEAAVGVFVAAPSQQTLDAARAAWIAARPLYIQTEAFRFYDGPIDGPPHNLEARINGWPLDEAYIDYVDGMPMAGIVNDVAGFPTIDAPTLADANEKGGEKNLSTGWHAIEFLLWGQDHDPTGPGSRPFTDYVTGAGGTAQNQARRSAYLTAVTSLLVKDLEDVTAQWERSKADTYAGRLLAGDADVGLRNAFQGVLYLAAVELPKERMFLAYSMKDQEEEHSCFSDTTLIDHVNDGVGIENVWLGRFGGRTGPGLEALVRAKDPARAEAITKAIAAANAATAAIPTPFDQAILAPSGSEAASRIEAAMKGWDDVAALLGQAAGDLGYRILIQ